jgi:hypothetical protein
MRQLINASVFVLSTSFAASGCAADATSGGGAGPEEKVGTASSAITNARIQIIGLSASDHQPWHAIKTPTSMTYFSAMAPQTGDLGGLADIDAIQIPNGDLHVVAATLSGGLYHAVRFNDGSWTQWGNVKGQVGDYGAFTRVGICFDTVSSEFYVIGIAGGRPWATYRHADGSWYPHMYDVDDAGVGPNWGDVDCAYSGNTGHLVAITQGGVLYHKIIEWTNFAHVAGDPGGFESIDATVVGRGTLRVTGNSWWNGTVFATSLNPSTGVWSAFQDLRAPYSGFEKVTGAELLGELHVIAAGNLSQYPHPTWSNTLYTNGTWSGWGWFDTPYSTSYFDGANHSISWLERVTASGGLAY